MERVIIITLFVLQAIISYAQTPQQVDSLHQRGRELANEGRYYYHTGDKTKAAKLWEQALPLVEKYGDVYESLLNNLGYVYNELKDKESLRHIMELTEEHNQHELTKPCDEPECMLDRALYYMSVENNPKAKECFLATLAMPMGNELELKALEYYAQFLSNIGDYVGSSEYYRAAAQHTKDYNGENANFGRLLYLSALCSSLGADYSSSATAFELALQFFKNQDQSAYNEEITTCLKRLGEVWSAQGNYEQATVWFHELIQYLEQTDKGSPEYPKAIEKLAYNERQAGQYDASIDYYLQAMKIYEERGMDHDNYSAASSLLMCYSVAGKYNEMPDSVKEMINRVGEKGRIARQKERDRLLRSFLDDLELVRDYGGKLSYANSLGNIASIYAAKERYDSAADYYRQYIEVLREAIRDAFRLQNESERMSSWEDQISNVNSLIEALSSLPDEDPLKCDYASWAYDVELLSKGILLNSSIEFEKVLSDKHDDALTQMYEQSKINAAEIERLRTEADSEADLERMLSLTRKNQALQLELYKKCAEYADFTNYISYNWRDVQEAMNKQDVAIEFVADHQDVLGERMIALVLTKDMKSPIAVRIWEGDSLEVGAATPFHQQLQQSMIEVSILRRFDRTIFQNMKEKLTQTPTPYKTELALLLQYMETKYAADSTHLPYLAHLGLVKYRDLLGTNDSLYTASAAADLIWGPISKYLTGKKRIYFSADGILNNIGIEYLQYNGKPLSEQFEVYRLSSTKELCYKRKRIKPSKAVLFGDINYNDEASKPESVRQSLATLRGAGDTSYFADLGNTLKEVDGIRSILNSNGVKDVVRFRDTEASKSAFIDLTDTKVDLLHIATHGMYRKNTVSTDAESMHNSLLVFAGANLDDGALVTAADIAKMNLRQCDLAVLSACETGLGKLSDDGVFGLQRGFKNAGVHTLLMSLKNVYDESTADLMISFYRHLMNGSSKRESLVKAQKDIREKGFDDPKFWATFILLDAF